MGVNYFPIVVWGKSDTHDVSKPHAVPAESHASPIADRIRAYVAEVKRVDPKFSMRKLSERAALNPSQLSMVLRRLDDGGHVSHDVLRSVATAMGRPYAWLVGDQAAEQAIPRFGELPGWDAAVADAASRFYLSPAAIAGIAYWIPDAVPRHLDAKVVRTLAQLWEDLQGK